MTNSDKLKDGKLSRRDFLKMGIASGAALVLNGLTQKVALAASPYFGLDSNSTNCCDMPLNFYIGKGGENLNWYDGYFNYISAKAVGYYNTYTYWVLHGPDDAPTKTYTGYYAYGKNQALKYVYAWAGAASWASKAGAVTFFADVEPYLDENGNVISYLGWQNDGSAASKTNNRRVLNGFLDYIANYQDEGQNAGFMPGFYTTPALFKTWFGTGFRTSTAAVLWVTGCRTNASSICKPCSTSCYTTIENVTAALPTIQKTTLGGNKAVIWQYWIDCPGDWDVSTQSGYRGFNPSRVVSTAAQYVLSC